MWDESQLRLALGATAQSPNEAKSVAASTDAGESVEAGEQVMMAPQTGKQDGDGDGKVVMKSAGEVNGSAAVAVVAVAEGGVHLQEELGAVKKQNVEVKEQNATMVAEIESLRKLIEVKDEAAKQADMRALEVEAKLAKHMEQHQMLVVEKEGLGMDLSAKVAEVAGLNEQVPSLEKELEDFKVQNSELALGFSKLSEAKKEVEMRSEMLRQSKDASDEALKKMTDRLRDKQRDRDSLASRAEEAERSVEELTAQLDNANAEIRAMTDALPKGQKELQDQITDLRNQVHKTEVLLEDSKQEKVSIEAKLAELQQSERDNMYMGILGGAASTLCVGGLYQLCINGFRK